MNQRPNSPSNLGYFSPRSSVLLRKRSVCRFRPAFLAVCRSHTIFDHIGPFTYASERLKPFGLAEHPLFRIRRRRSRECSLDLILIEFDPLPARSFISSVRPRGCEVTSEVNN